MSGPELGLGALARSRGGGLGGRRQLPRSTTAEDLEGYTDPWHLLPAAVAAVSLVVGLALETPAPAPEDTGPSPS